MRRFVHAVADRLRHDRALLGTAAILGAVALFAAVYFELPKRVVSPGGHTVTAVFADAQTLAEGDPVRVRGVAVGEVEKITLDPGGRSATVRMSVSDDALPLHADAHATARWRSLFGAAFVVDLDPGTRGAGELRGRRLGLRQTDTQVLLEDVTSVVRGEARAGLRSMLRELPRALRDPAAPRRALRALSDTAPPLRAGLRAVQGERRGDLRQLVANTARTVRALDAPTGAMRAVVQGAATTFATTARRGADVRAALATAGASLPRVRRTADRLGTTLRLADPLIDSLQASAAPLAPTASRLRRTLTAADGLLGDADPLVRDLRPAVASLRSAARTGAPVLAEVRPSVTRLADSILPRMATRSPESRRTTYEIIGPAFAGMTGAFASFDANNNFIRFTASLSETSFESAPCSTTFTDPRPGEVVTCDALTSALRRLLDPAKASRRRP